jgi:hypothetical protein
MQEEADAEMQEEADTMQEEEDREQGNLPQQERKHEATQFRLPFDD